MSDPWPGRLSEYVDGEMTPGDRADLEGHLATCEGCRDELDGLRRIVERIDAAPDREPAADLWPGIARRLQQESGPPAGRPAPAASSGTAWRLLAAAAAVAVVLGGAWMLRSRGPGEVEEPFDSAQGGPVPMEVPEEVRDAAGRYHEAAAAWRALVARRRLPAEMEDALRTDLAAFDRAIEETLAALEKDPGDSELRAHLTRTLRAQIRFLARVEASAGEVS